MNIRQLRYFLSVAEAKSFTKAAERIRIAQPALSRQIQILEDDLGTPLLIRHGRGVQLTECGKLLRERAEALIHQLEHIREEIESSSDEPVGTVRLGVPQTLRSILVAPVLEKFCKRYPRSFLHVRVSTSETLREAFSNGQLDIAILLSDEPSKSLLCTELLSQQMALVGSKSDWPGFKEPVNAKDLADLPLILPRSRNGLRMLVQDYMSRQGYSMRLQMEVSEIDLMLSLVRQGVGFTVLPKCCFYGEQDRRRVSAVLVNNLFISWKIATAKDRYEPPAVQKLKEMLIREARGKAEEEIRLI